MIEKKVFGKMQKALKGCKKYDRNATFVADSNGCGVRCSYGELLYRRRVADKQGCADAFCVTAQLLHVFESFTINHNFSFSPYSQIGQLAIYFLINSGNASITRKKRTNVINTTSAFSKRHNTRGFRTRCYSTRVSCQIHTEKLVSAPCRCHFARPRCISCRLQPGSSDSRFFCASRQCKSFFYSLSLSSSSSIS